MYYKAGQTSKKEIFAKIAVNWKLVTILAKILVEGAINWTCSVKKFLLKMTPKPQEKSCNVVFFSKFVDLCYANIQRKDSNTGLF